jgi:hypothetical protein
MDGGGMWGFWSIFGWIFPLLFLVVLILLGIALFRYVFGESRGRYYREPPPSREESPPSLSDEVARLREEIRALCEEIREIKKE